ncbi:hypothetical protein QUA23_01195 [Microcoleus sp. Pol1C5]
MLLLLAPVPVGLSVAEEPAFFALFLRCAVRSNFSLGGFHPMQILAGSQQRFRLNLVSEL